MTPGIVVGGLAVAGVLYYTGRRIYRAVYRAQQLAGWKAMLPEGRRRERLSETFRRAGVL